MYLKYLVIAFVWGSHLEVLKSHSWWAVETIRDSWDQSRVGGRQGKSPTTILALKFNF